MRQQTLRTVALESVDHATRAATTVVGAYRAGFHRVIEAVNEGMHARGVERVKVYAPRLTAAVRRGSAQGGDLTVKGVDAVCDRTEQLIVRTSAGVATQVRRAAQLSDGVENRWLASGLNTASRISMPGAKVALAFSRGIDGGASRLAEVAGVRKTRPVKAAVVKVRRAAKAAPKVIMKKPARKAAVKVERAARAVVRKAPVVKAARDTATTAQ